MIKMHILIMKLIPQDSREQIGSTALNQYVQSRCICHNSKQQSRAGARESVGEVVEQVGSWADEQQSASAAREES